MHAFHASPPLPGTPVCFRPCYWSGPAPAFAGADAGCEGGAPARAAAAGTGKGRPQHGGHAGRKKGAAGRCRRRAGKEAAYGKRGMVCGACGGMRARPAALHEGREEAREAACAAVRHRAAAGAALLQPRAAERLHAAGPAQAARVGKWKKIKALTPGSVKKPAWTARECAPCCCGAAARRKRRGR